MRIAQIKILLFKLSFNPFQFLILTSLQSGIQLFLKFCRKFCFNQLIRTIGSNRIPSLIASFG